MSAIAHFITDQLAIRKSTDIKEWNAMLAERVEESPDRTQYMIYLRKGVRWHRPTVDMREYPWLDKAFEVTASDVKFTIDMIRDPNTLCPLKVYFEEITAVDILDPHTVKITWKRPNFYARATTLEIMPLPEHIWAYDPSGQRYAKDSVGAQFNNHWYGNKRLLGNGPYRFAQYDQAVKIRMERNDNYWGQRAPCREFNLLFLTDEETRLAKFWNGETPIHGLQPEQYRRIILEGEQPEPVRKYEDRWRPAPGAWKYTSYTWLPPVYGGFAWNMRRPTLSDARVRRAMTLCLNRDKLIEKLRYGLGTQIAVGETVTSNYYPKGTEPLPFDIVAARKLLDDAGWKDSDGDGTRDKLINGQKRDLSIELVIAASSPFQVDMGQLYKDDLQKAGIELVVNPIQSALWAQKNSERDFDGLVIFWYAGIDSDPKQLWDSKAADEPGSNNYTGFKNAEADAIFEALITTFDYDKRIERLGRFYEIQEQTQPYTWIFHAKSFVLTNADWRFPEPKLDFPYVDHRLTWRWKSRP